MKFDEWLTDFIDFLIDNAGKLITQQVVQNRYGDVKRPTLLNWLERACSTKWVARVDINNCKIKVAYALHAQALERLQRAAQSCHGAPVSV